jgi:two-component system CheB/CheR fusion protein
MNSDSRQTSESDATQRSTSSFPEKPINILIVDDEPKNLMVLESLLDDPTYRLVRAESADEALLALVVEEFALLILDVRMPGMSGFELAQMIKDRKKTAKVPIIFLSAYYNEDQHVLDGYGMGAVDYLHKPVNPMILRSKVAVFAELHLKNRESAMANRALLAEVMERRRAEEKLRELNETLEQRVKLRTEALEMANAAINESGERYRSLFEGSLDGIFSLSCDGYFQTANPSALRIIGRKLDDLKTVHFLEVIAPDHRPLAEKALRGAFCDEYLTLDVAVISTNGERHDVFISGAPAMVDGKAVGVSCIAREITERKNAERALRRREAELRSLADNSPDIIARFDTQLRHVFINAAVGRATGLPPEAFLGKTYWDLQMPPKLCEQWDVALHSVLDSGQETIIEFGYARPESERLFEARLIPELESDGRVGHVLAIIRDVTEARGVGEQLRRAKESAESASAAKDRFLAVLSHELRTPLAPVRLAISIWERRKDLLPLEFQEDLAMIRRNVDLECRLIDDLLDLNRIVRGKLDLRFTLVNLHDEIRHAVRTIQDEASSKQIMLSFILDATDHHVKADATRLQQVLWNLLKNAVKFTSSAGAVTVRTYGTSEDRVCVEVRDTGSGIEPAALEQIFNAFEQGGAHVARQFGGMGLGLAISRAITTMHGGKLSASSEGQGRGATFTLELAIAHPAQQSVAERISPTIPDFGLSNESRTEICRILLVEDHVDTAKLLKRLLKSTGYHVQTAGTVAEALSVAESHEFDLVISDLGLPDGSGYDLVRQMVARRPTKAIALSGFGMQEDVQFGRDAGFAMHLTKPVNFEQLEICIQRMMAAGDCPISDATCVPHKQKPLLQGEP